jgi:hypothetical protein
MYMIALVRQHIITSADFGASSLTGRLADFTVFNQLVRLKLDVWLISQYSS